MAEGGTWQSGVFDSVSGFHQGDKEGTPSPRVTPTIYNPPAPLHRDKEDAAIPSISIALRCAAILFSMIAFTIIAANSICRKSYGHGCLPLAIKNRNFRYLLVINVLVCFYLIVQLVLSILSGCTLSTALKGPKSKLATITFLFDQVLMYMLTAGCGAGATSLDCPNTYHAICAKNAAAVAMSFGAFAFIALSTALAYFHLYMIA